ncbi:MAG: hypothetical protein IJH41_03660 [Eubacterium sp.]|nr:hypothetical protein [Eubacterium sp.]
MIIVEVYSPSVDASYDFQIDENISAAEAAGAVSEMIARKNGSEASDDNAAGAYGDAALYDTDSRRELDRLRTLKENGVTSGRRLLLV